jgi:hemerythrin superfamily protein
MRQVENVTVCEPRILGRCLAINVFEGLTQEQRSQMATKTQVSRSKKANPLTPEGSEALAESFFQQLRDRFLGHKAEQIDIIDVIKEDHKALKELLPILKSEKASFAEKKSTFKLFAAALEAHAKPEEKTWYVKMKKSSDLKIDGLEGDVEHALADQLATELKSTRDKDMFMAKVKVLAEMLEHHIKEEEEDMLPDYKKNSTSAERQKLGAKYLKLRSAYLTN